jgi:hypothetical protein
MRERTTGEISDSELTLLLNFASVIGQQTLGICDLNRSKIFKRCLDSLSHVEITPSEPAERKVFLGWKSIALIE